MQRTLTLRRLALAAVAAALLPALPTSAFARDGGDDDRREVRVKGSCGRGATAKLKLKERDGRIEAEFEVDRNRAGERWRVVLSHDGRVTHRLNARTSGRSGSFSVERSLPDYSGADRVSARGYGPKGLTCTAAAVLTT